MNKAVADDDYTIKVPAIPVACDGKLQRTAWDSSGLENRYSNTLEK